MCIRSKVRVSAQVERENVSFRDERRKMLSLAGPLFRAIENEEMYPRNGLMIQWRNYKSKCLINLSVAKYIEEITK